VEHDQEPGKSDGLNLKDFRAGASGKNRRREKRVRTSRLISISPCRQNVETRFQTVSLTDCSAHSIGILSPAPMTVGEEFIVRLDLDRPLFLVYVARNCRRDEGKCRIGAELVGIVGGTTDDANEIFKILIDASATS